MSDSVQPHRWQPIRLPCPWDSPGKNTGVGCHFLLQWHESEKWKWSRSVVSDSVKPHRWQPIRLPCPWDSPGKNTGVGCHCLLRILLITPSKNQFSLILIVTKVKDNSEKMQVKCSSKLSRSSETRTVYCHCQKDPKGKQHLIQCILDEVLKQKKDFGLKWSVDFR